MSCILFYQVNRLVNALLAIIADQNVLRGKNDFLLRRKAAHLLARVRVC